MDLENMTVFEKKEWAKNPNTSVDFLQELTKDKNPAVRAYTALNSRIPIDSMKELAEDIQWSVRREVAKNSNTPENLLRFLAKDRDPRVRQDVAENVNTPEDALQKLATDADNGVRIFGHKNPNSSSKILVLVFEYEKSLKVYNKTIIKALYAHVALPHVAKKIIETLFGEMV